MVQPHQHRRAAPNAYGAGACAAAAEVGAILPGGVTLTPRAVSSGERRSHFMIRQCSQASQCLLGLCLVAFQLAGAAPAAPPPPSWTQFRGPNQNGSLEVESIPLVWSADSHIA